MGLSILITGFFLVLKSSKKLDVKLDNGFSDNSISDENNPIIDVDIRVKMFFAIDVTFEFHNTKLPAMSICQYSS